MASAAGAGRSRSIGEASEVEPLSGRTTSRHSAAMRQRTEDLGPAERQLLDDVDEYGLHIVHVPGEDDGPGFSFTVGLWHTYQQAEVIVFGLDEEVAHELLNALADECDDGRRFAADSKQIGRAHV